MKNLNPKTALATLALLGAGSVATANVLQTDTVSSLPRMTLELESLEGEISAVEAGSFDLMVGEVRHTVRIDESTKYRLDDKDATKDQVLTAGRTVTVELQRGLATSVKAKKGSEAGQSAWALETTKGKIRKVEEESFVIMVEDEAKTFQLSETTTYWLDGKEVTKDEVLVKDKQVSVEHADGTASKVSARSSF